MFGVEGGIRGQGQGMRRAVWGEVCNQVRTRPGATGLSSEMAHQGAPVHPHVQRGAQSGSPTTCTKLPARMAMHCLLLGQLWGFVLCCKTQHCCLQKWKSRAKGQLQKNMGVEATRTSPSSTPETRPHETGAIWQACESGSSFQVSFTKKGRVLMEAAFASCFGETLQFLLTSLWGTGLCYICLLILRSMSL